MKKINLCIKIKSQEEVTCVQVIGEYDCGSNTIFYTDEKVQVELIMGEKVVLTRCHPDYKMQFTFAKEQTYQNEYEIYQPKMTLDLETTTQEVLFFEHSLHVEYTLKLSNEEMGAFVIDFDWEEK